MVASKKLLIIGFDPGPIPGIAGLWFLPEDTHIQEAHFGFAQCDPLTVEDVFDSWLQGEYSDDVILATETFVVGARAGRTSSAMASQITREVLSRMEELARERDIAVVTRPAANVMKWATDEKLEAANILHRTRGCAHARAATRHALYAAVHDAQYPDPQSRRMV